MFVKRDPEEILTWFLSFQTMRPKKWWLRAVIRGRFTHVSAFAFSQATGTWIFIDPNLERTRIFVVPEAHAASSGALATYSNAACILKMTALPISGYRFRPLFSCVSSIRHLVGLPALGLGAVSVDRLWSDCLANGAEIVTDASAPAPAA